MKISKDVYFKIFEKNFDYKIIETEMGEAIQMPPADAFIYSCVTGAGYLENPIYPFTPKGLLKLFYNAFDYKFVTGIFDNTTLKNTPLILSQAKEYLFTQTKYVVPVEFVYEGELTDYLRRQFSSITNPQDYIIQRIEMRKIGNGMEPFLEFLAAEYFKNRGYIVENQIPLAHSVGSPDFGAYSLDKVTKSLNSFGFLPGCGFHIIELAMIRLNRHLGNQGHNTGNHLVVGEAKTNSRTMTRQLEKYLDTGLFDIGFEIHPAKTKPATDYFGLITLGADFELKIIPPEKQYEPSHRLSKVDYVKWLTNYMKFYLLANLTNDELSEFYYELNNSRISSQADIVRFVAKMDVETLLNRIGVL